MTFDGSSFDVTQFTAYEPAARQVVDVQTAAQRRQKGSQPRTEFAKSSSDDDIASPLAVTGELEPQSRPRQFDDEREKLANSRGMLLALEYAGQGTREVVLRSAILNERLRRMDPRVTPEMVNLVESMTRELEKSTAVVGAIAERYRGL